MRRDYRDNRKETFRKYAKVPVRPENYGVRCAQVRNPEYGVTEYRVLRFGLLLGYVFSLRKAVWYYRFPTGTKAVGPFKSMTLAALKLKRSYQLQETVL